MTTRTATERAQLIDEFCESPATQLIVSAIERQIKVMDLREMQGLYEYVRQEAWLTTRRRAIDRGESFPKFEEFHL